MRIEKRESSRGSLFLTSSLSRAFRLVQFSGLIWLCRRTLYKFLPEAVEQKRLCNTSVYMLLHRFYHFYMITPCFAHGVNFVGFFFLLFILPR